MAVVTWVVIAYLLSQSALATVSVAGLTDHLHRLAASAPWLSTCPQLDLGQIRWASMIARLLTVASAGLGVIS